MIALASFWLVVPTYLLYYVVQPLSRSMILLAFVLGFSATVSTIAGASRYEVIIAMTA